MKIGKYAKNAKNRIFSLFPDFHFLRLFLKHPTTEVKTRVLMGAWVLGRGVF
jgi:hypothetical protein